MRMGDLPRVKAGVGVNFGVTPRERLGRIDIDIHDVVHSHRDHRNRHSARATQVRSRKPFSFKRLRARAFLPGDTCA